MRRQAILTVSLIFFSSAAVRADFSYDQSTKITGGAMASMMKVAGAFSKAAREPMVSSVYVKGDRMAHLHGRTAQIIDLKAETITDIDTEKKTYSVMTFEQMRQMLDEMSKKMAGKKAENPNADMKFKVSVKDTGVKKVVNGMDTKEAVLTLTMEGTDQKSGEKGDISFVSDMFLAPQIAGYEEVRNFQMRMAEKLKWNPGNSGFASMMQQPGAGQGMAELAKESAKLDGVPVHQITRMGTLEAITAAANAPPQPEGQQKQGPTAGQAANSAATDSAASAIADRLGKLGGFGGFGKKKKAEPDQPPADAPPQGGGSQQPPANAGGVLLEMTSDMSNFSSSPVDPSKLEVPAGFKQVESRMEKREK
jgi:hypothetical protein